jgi:uncharacterized protein
MSPEERQLLTGLFDRTRNAASTPRDPEAEALISDQVKAQPYAPYLIAQAVLVQEQALKAANEKLQALEAQIADMQQQQQPGRAPAPAGSGFLSGLGSLFGAGNPQSAPPPPRGPGESPWQQPPQGFGQQNYGPPPSQPPWGSAAPQAGGFLKGALGAAAGVAGGVLLADSIRGLFGQHNNSLGINSGLDKLGQNPGGETVVNNYYENSDPDTGSRGNANFADSDYAGPEDASYDTGSSDDFDT